MKTSCYHLVQSQPPAQTPLSPPPILEWGIVITALVSGAAYFGRWILDQTATKEKSETDLMRGLIANLQDVQGQLIRDSKEAKLQLIEHIDLKDTLGRATALLKDDVARALNSQTGMYVESLKNQQRMESKLDASLRQGDRIEKVVETILERLSHDSPQ